MTDITWTPAEWGDDENQAVETYHEGFTADVSWFPPMCPGERGYWFWSVSATSEVSEYPEMQDGHSAPSLEEGKRKATAAIKRAATMRRKAA